MPQESAGCISQLPLLLCNTSPPHYSNNVRDVDTCASFLMSNNKEPSFFLLCLLSFTPKRGKLARDSLGGSVTLEKTACINMV